MQIVAYREEAKPTYRPRNDIEEILHFPLHGALTEGNTLALNIALGTLSCLGFSNGLPELIKQQQFTNNELSVLRPLLESYPYYCPYEVLFASFYNGDITDALIESCRERLQDSLETGSWEQDTRPIRNVLSRVRIKLRAFNLNISSILETGYILKVNATPAVHKAG